MLHYTCTVHALISILLMRDTLFLKHSNSSILYNTTVWYKDLHRVFCYFYILVFMFIYRGNTTETKGTAFVVYEDIFDAKNACDHLSGFNVCNRYLVVLYFQPNKVSVGHSIIINIFYHNLLFLEILLPVTSFNFLAKAA